MLATNAYRNMYTSQTIKSYGEQMRSPSWTSQEEHETGLHRDWESDNRMSAQALEFTLQNETGRV